MDVEFQLACDGFASSTVKIKELALSYRDYLLLPYIA
jgi:hypothetical protein